MAVNTIDAKMLAKMFLAGAKNLESKKEWINELNVFPVPDGDTGTNMTLTIMSAAKDVAADNGVHREGSLIRFLKRRQRQLRRHFIAAVQRLHQSDPRL